MTTTADGLRGRRATSDLTGVLHEVPLFEGLQEPHLSELIGRSRRRVLVAGQTLFLEGDHAGGFYIVLAGRIKVYKTSPKGRQQILMIMKKGDPIGEVAALSGDVYPAGAEALEPAEALYVPRRAFVELVRRDPEVAMRLLATLSARLRAFTSLIGDLSLREVGGRLAAQLLILAGEEGAGQPVVLTLSRAQLSAAVGTVPETLSRAFRQLKSVGAVETRGRTVIIKDRRLLEKLACS